MPAYVTVPERDPLQDPVLCLKRQELVPLLKVAILDAFWADPGPLFDPSRPPPAAYFEYFESTTLAVLYKWDSSKYDTSSLKFHHLADVAKYLQQGIKRNEIEGFLGEVLSGDARDVAGEVVDLTVKLLYMVPIWSFWNEGETSLTWCDGTIEAAFARHFRAKEGGERSRSIEKNGIKSPMKSPGLCLSPGLQSPGLEVQQVKRAPSTREKERGNRFDKAFCLKELEEVCGMKIQWTGNLLDHLRLKSTVIEEGVEEKSLCIFHHASFLCYQARSDIYPTGLLSETLRTLSLLLPSSAPETADYFLPHQIQHHLDSEAAHCRPLDKADRNIEKFEYWKERLGILKEIYEMYRPPVTPKGSGLRRFLSVLQLKDNRDNS